MVENEVEEAEKEKEERNCMRGGKRYRDPPTGKCSHLRLEGKEKASILSRKEGQEIGDPASCLHASQVLLLSLHRKAKEAEETKYVWTCPKVNEQQLSFKQGCTMGQLTLREEGSAGLRMTQRQEEGQSGSAGNTGVA